MTEEIGFENSHFRNFSDRVTLTLKVKVEIFDIVRILSSTSTHIPNFI
jgi:hypothetical protein